MMYISALMAAMPSSPRTAASEAALSAAPGSSRDSASMAAVSWIMGSLHTPLTALSASRCSRSGESRILHLSILTRLATSKVLLPKARCTYLSGSWGWLSANQSAARECQRAISSSEAPDRIFSFVSGLRRTSLFLPNLTRVDMLVGSSSLRTSRRVTHSHPMESLTSRSSPASSSSENPSIPFVRAASVNSSPSDLSLSLAFAASSLPLGVRK
jgi:hypothetical protein